MVSLAKSSALVVSFCYTSRALLTASFRASTLSQRRGFLATTLVTAATFSTPSTGTVFAQGTGDISTKRTMSTLSTGYLNAADAAALDAELMSTPGFSLEQLMELAGLSVAEAVYQVLTPSTSGTTKPKILLVCGPGNNGGDGLVAARHLMFFGYQCDVFYPKPTNKEHFVNLVHQCKDVDVSFLEELPSDLTEYNGIVDAIFGFSFKGEPREPFATALQQIIHAQQQGGVPVISVDVPSGWNVDEGDVNGSGFIPDVLVSLTTPKQSARTFPGRHFVGGRFLPPKLATKYNVQMPPYPGVSQVMEVTNLQGELSVSVSVSSSIQQQDYVQQTHDDRKAMTSWEAEYAAYLQEKEVKQHQDPTDTLAPPTSSSSQSNSEGDSWERQYAEYCAEKEARLALEDAKQIEEMKRQLS